VADILGLPVFVASNSASAASGGALLAKYAWWKAMKGHENGTFEEMRKDYGELTLECVARPHDELVKIYKGVVDSYRRCEEEVVHEYRTNTRSHDR
jgi:xylulokinase